MSENISREQIRQIRERFKDFDNEGLDIGTTISNMLSLPEDEFQLLAPGVLQSFQQSINNPNDELILVQALNAVGGQVDDIEKAFISLSEEIDKLKLPQMKREFLKQICGAIVNAIKETDGISKRIIQIPIELCHKDAAIPQYAHISDSGLDVYALEDITVKPGETLLVPTGIKVAIPVGYELQVRPKSGRALKTKLRVANTPGTIDQGYRDEIKVIIENVEAPIKDITYDFDEKGRPVITSILHGSDFTIGKGEKFCQLVLAMVPKASFYRVDTVLGIGENRGGGFGSTGLK